MNKDSISGIVQSAKCIKNSRIITMQKFEFHSAANEFPLLDSKKLSALAKDIQENGLKVPISLFENQILDGRNRYLACQKIGVDPVFANLPPDIDPFSYVWSLNGERRDITADQRYLIWKHCNEMSDAWLAEQKKRWEEANKEKAKAAREQHQVSKPYAGEKMVRGQSVPAPSRKSKHPDRKAKAEESKTNRGAVKRGDQLTKERPDLAEKVRRGEMKPATAYQTMKKDAVADKVQELPDGKYRILYADPPWHYNDSRGPSLKDLGAVGEHYPTMSIEELCALNVKNLAADNSVLFLWTTAPMLEDSFKVVKAWGFKHKTQFIWDKVKSFFGHYSSVRHELLLVCTRGNCTPDVPKLFDSVQIIKKQKHSQKPEHFRKIIDTLYPHGPRIELFARGKISSTWVAWGNEA